MITVDDVEDLNTELDEVNDSAFKSSVDAWHAICMVLEEHGIMIPIVEEVEDEMEFKVLVDGQETSVEVDTGLYLYCCIDEEDGNYKVFAVVDTISMLEEMDTISEDSPEE